MTKIKTPSDPIEGLSIKVLIYGQPGIGKSTYALTAPNPLVIDCDNGIRRVLPQHRKDYIPVTSWDDIMSVMSEDLSKYDTIVMDTVGKALDYCGQAIIKESPKYATGGALNQRGYGMLKMKFAALFQAVNTLGKNLVFVAHDKEKSENEDTIVRPDITGSSLATVIREMDLVGYMSARNRTRTISFDATDKEYGKNTCGLPPTIESDGFSLLDVLNQYKEQQSQIGAMAGDYADLVEVIKNKIETVMDAESATLITEELKSLEPIWDSVLVAQELLRSRLKEIGLKYDRKGGQYVRTEPQAV